jgi:hypothetical protein
VTRPKLFNERQPSEIRYLIISILLAVSLYLDKGKVPERVGDVDICDAAEVVEVVHEVLLGEVLCDPAHEYLAGGLLLLPTQALLLLAVRVLNPTTILFKSNRKKINE